MKYIKFLMLAVMLFSLGAHAADPPAAATYRALDDKLYVLGTDNDFQITYDSGDNRLEIRDASGNVLGRVSDAGTTGVVGFKQFDVINGSVASQITSGATSNRAVTLPDAAGEISLLGQTITSSEIANSEIVNADISASAAIVPTKFSAGTDGQVVVTASSASGWGTVPSAGITDGTIVNADINASAGIAITKLSTSGASTNYVLTYNGSAIVWASPASVGDISAGSGLGTDNLIPRMHLTGSDTLQGYSSNNITADDAGLLSVPGGITSSGGIIRTEGGTIALSASSYLKWLRTDEPRWEVSYSAGTETGTSGETSLLFIASDNDGNALRDVMKLNRTASEGVVFGTNSAPSPIYVKGDIYAHTTDAQIVDDGKVLLTALAQTSATTGQVLAWDGSKYAPSSSGTGNVSNLGAGTDNSVARFNASGTAIQESQVIIDDSGNLDAAGTLTAGSANTVLTASTGIILDAALSSNVVVAGDALTGDVTVTLEADGSTVAAIGSGVIVDADVNASAAIAESKLALARTYWMSAGAVWPAASSGCSTPALDANNNVACAFAASTTGYISVPVPSNYDGSTENVAVYWYKATDTNSVTWTIESVVIADNGDETATTATGTITNTAAPASATNVNIDNPTSTTFFGASSNAGKWARIKISTNAYSGGTASLLGIKVEY